MIFSGKYEVTEKVGQGGMGIVYRVRHLDLDTDLALKILPRDLSQDAELVERFRREARMMARLNHRNIVRVFDFVRDGDNYYLIMEFLQGKNLHQILHSRGADKLLLPDVLRIGAQIAEALAYAHEQTPAVVHRDIKPSNIIIEDKTARAVVTDFGIAKLMDQAQSDLTRSGLFVGTPKYCAPEQLRHDDDLDARVDIYSLGMVMYELYTGKQFFAGLKDHEVIGRVLYEKLENTLSFPDAPPVFTELVERAIMREREARYQTAAEFAADLQACLRALEPSGAGGEIPAADETSTGDMGAIEAQIRALESKRLQRLARQAQGTCRKAREGAQRAGAADEAATEFGAAREREVQAEAQLETTEYEPAAVLFHEAAAGFESAATVARARTLERGVADARTAMQGRVNEAEALEASSVAAGEWQRAQALAAEAEKIAAGNEHEAAAAKFGEAAEAYVVARSVAERVHDLRAVQAELPSVVSARASAEQAAAAELAADAFAAAVRDQERLERAVAEGELTEARALLQQVCRAFEAAAAAAIAVRGKRATVAARERMAAAGDAARAVGAADLAADELAAAAALAAAGTRAEGTAEWETAQSRYAEAAGRYEKVRELALARREEQRVQRELTEARAAADAARSAAEGAGAPEEAATFYGRAIELADRATAAAESGDLSRAVSDYRQATDQYTQSAQVAVRRAQRVAVEATVAEVAAARKAAVAAGAEGSEAFTGAEEAEGEAERALAGDDLTATAAAAERALAQYRSAAAAAELAGHLHEADEAMARVESGRTQALEAGANGAEAGEVFGAAEQSRHEAVESRRHDDWERVLAHAASAEEQYKASVAQTVETLKAHAHAAKTAAEKAGVQRQELADAERAEREAGEQLAGGAAGAAARAYREAAERYASAGEQQRVAAEEARRQATEARRDAEKADAARFANDLLTSGTQRFTAAENDLHGERFGTAASAFAESARTFAEAATNAETARRREAATTSRAAAEDARGRAQRAGAADLPGDALAAAGRTLAEAEGAFANGDFAAAERAFQAASTAFTTLEREGQKARAEGEARAAADRAQGLRKTRGAAARGLRVWWRLRGADGALNAGASALAQGDFARATAAFDRASEILESLPLPEPAPVKAPPLAVERPRSVATGDVTRMGEAGGAATVMGEAPAAPTRVGEVGGAATVMGEVAAPTRVGDVGGAATVMGETPAAPTMMGAAGGAATVMGETPAAPTLAGGVGEAATMVGESTAPAGLVPGAAEGAPARAPGGKAGKRAKARAETVKARGAEPAKARGAEVAKGRAETTTRIEARAEVPVITPAPATPSRMPWIASAAGALVVIGALLTWGLSRGPTTDVEKQVDLSNAERVAETEKQAETERVAASKKQAEAERVAAEKQAEAERAAAAEKQAEAERIAAAAKQAEAERAGLAEKQAEADRIAALQKQALPTAAIPTAVPIAPPRIERFEPGESVVRLQPGASESFRIELADAEGASYRWTVGGRALSDARGPSVTIPVKDEPQQVVVVASTKGGEATHRWELASLPRATPVAPVGPPVVQARVPDDPSFNLEVGSKGRLGVTVKSVSGDRLTYAWSVDGKRVGRDAPSFEFVPADADEGEVRRVKVQITNAARETIANEWAVTVPPGPVKIVRKSPAEDVTASIGDQKELTVEARAGRAEAPLSYRWSVDGRTLNEATGPRLAYRVDKSRADVQVTVEAPGRQAAIGRWRIRAESVPTPKIETPPASAQREVEQWIESYRQAYQDKNVDRLIALGVVPADQRGKMTQVLGDLEDLEVRIASRTIDTVNAETATVTLSRVDSFRIGRNRTEKVIPIKKTLRKRNGTWVAE